MEPLKFAYESMGTRWEITVWDDLRPVVFNEFAAAILEQSQEFDQTYSRFIRNSFVRSIEQKTGKVEVPEDFVKMLELYKNLYDLSGKKINPLIGNTISDMGYDADYTLIPKKMIRPTPDLDEAVQILGDRRINISEPVLFDFGALGKGYFVDKIADFLRKKNVQRFLVNGSGDIYYRGNGVPIKAGLEHPGDPSKVIGSVEMVDGAMCASGTNRRRWDRYHHIIDPQTLSSPEEILGVWVTAPSAAQADALATCLFFTEPERYHKNFTFDYCILNRNYQVKRSRGFLAELF